MITWRTPHGYSIEGPGVNAIRSPHGDRTVRRPCRNVDERDPVEREVRREVEREVAAVSMREREVAPGGPTGPASTRARSRPGWRGTSRHDWGTRLHRQTIVVSRHAFRRTPLPSPTRVGLLRALIAQPRRGQREVAQVARRETCKCVRARSASEDGRVHCGVGGDRYVRFGHALTRWCVFGIGHAPFRRVIELAVDAACSSRSPSRDVRATP